MTNLSLSTVSGKRSCRSDKDKAIKKSFKNVRYGLRKTISNNLKHKFCIFAGSLCDKASEKHDLMTKLK